MESAVHMVGSIINTNNMNNMNTQQFFSLVTTGAIQKPLRPWKPFFKAVPEDFRIAFDSFEGAFDRHIATSIPMYREMQLITGNAIVKAYEDKVYPLLIDIAGSEGTWAKAITLHSGGNIPSLIVDCNEDMQESFYALGTPDNSDFRLGSFIEDYNDVKRYVPDCTAAIVHAGMAFQFMPFTRGDCIAEVKNRYLDKDGLFLIEEKVIPSQPREWFQNEILKNEFKRRYYSEEAIKQKQADVVDDMDANLVRHYELINALELHFKEVHQYYDAGNFVGYACSDSKATISRLGYKTITF